MKVYVSALHECVFICACVCLCVCVRLSLQFATICSYMCVRIRHFCMGSVSVCVCVCVRVLAVVSGVVVLSEHMPVCLCVWFVNLTVFLDCDYIISVLKT